MTRQTKQVFETILVAYDGSPQSQRVTDLAFSLAEAMWSKVLVFAVTRPPEPGSRVELNAVLEEAREHYEQSFVSLREQAKLTGVELETDIGVGHPAEQIVHRVEQATVSFICHGKTWNVHLSPLDARFNFRTGTPLCALPSDGDSLRYQRYESN
jgi:nucleotide-binding universal stress UspA family protein